MTRILATGDTHLGVGTVGLSDQEAVLNRIVDVALNANIDLFLHGGDVFEGPLVTPEQLRAFLNPMRRLREAGIPVLIALGNGRHDAAMRDVNGLDVLSEIPGIDISVRPENVLYPARVGHACTVSTLPWTSPARIIAETNGGDRDQVNQLAAELLVMTARDLCESASAELPKILLAHWSISSGALPNGLPVADLNEPVLEWAELDALGFDCIIAAHIHRSQRLDLAEAGDATVGLYVGSPQPLNHGEPGEHGVWILDVESAAVSTEFVPIASPQFVTLDADLTGGTDTSGLAYIDLGYGANDHLAAITEGAIVRCRVRATEEQWRRVDQAAIRDGLARMGAARVTFLPDLIRESRARAETLTDQLSPLEALHMYVDAQGIDEVTNGRMVERLRSWMEA